MGFFSWRTADTHETIWNRYAKEQGGGACRTVYMLQPDQQPPFEEPAYEGYGEFGGMDAYALLARMNRPDLTKGRDDDFARMIGCALVGGYHELVADGTKHAIFHGGAQMIDPAITHHAVTYAEPIEAFGGRTANELVKTGELVERHFQIDRPLKFSFRKDADYDALPGSPDCETQGFFNWEGEYA